MENYEPQDPLTKDLAWNIQATKSFQRNNPEVIITRFDKGNSTIILGGKEHIEKKMEEMLNDTNMYKRIDKNLISKYQLKINKVFKTL